MGKVLIIARNTFKELIRDRVIYGIFVLAFLLLMISLVVSQLSYVEQKRILMDLGLAGLEISGIILSVFLGATIVFREVERRTVLTLFARPLTRGQFLLGKFFGLLAIIVVAFLLLTLFLLGVLILAGWNFDSRLFIVILGFVFSSGVLVSLTMTLGTFVRPTLSVPLTIGIFLIGRSMDSLNYFLRQSDSTSFNFFVKIINHTFPNFTRFDWKSVMVHDASISGEQFLWALIYSFLWIVTLQSLANIIFRRKDIA